SPLPPSTTPFHLFSLHDALPISLLLLRRTISRTHNAGIILRIRILQPAQHILREQRPLHVIPRSIIRHQPPSISQILDNRLLKRDRKSTRLNSSHVSISYAVFCL